MDAAYSGPISQRISELSLAPVAMIEIRRRSRRIRRRDVSPGMREREHKAGEWKETEVERCPHGFL